MSLNMLWLELTPRCSLQCVHCYADSGPDRPLYSGLGRDDWAKALRQASDLGCKRVQFIGGEPTLHPALSDLVASERAALRF
jgi:MoaA/NifB/PqqE/SkfB family radical SAM enzyme